MHINFIDNSSLNPYTGYGKMEIGLVRELVRRGVVVRFPKILNYEGLGYISSVSKLGSNIAGNLDIFDDDLNLVIGNPINAPKRGINVLFTMSESDRVGDGWVSKMNSSYKIILVPCQDLVEVYKNSGVIIPVEYVPLGLDFPDFVPFCDRSERDNQTFAFLTYSYGDIRKGADLAIMAFKQAFGDDPTKEMWIKCRTRRGNWLNKFEDSQIKIFEGDYSEKEWYALLHKADAFVFPTRGEGFGLPPREAALSGMPVMSTQWLGTKDIDQWGVPIYVDAMRQAIFETEGANSKDAKWAMPDVTKMKYDMINIVGNYESQLSFVNDTGIPYLKTFTWESTVNKLIGVMVKHGYNYN